MLPLEAEGQYSTLHMCLSQVIQVSVPGFLTGNNEDEIHAYLTCFVSIKQDGVASV